MDKKLLAKQRQIIYEKFFISHDPPPDPYDSSYQTTELPQSEFSHLSNDPRPMPKKSETTFHFKQKQGDNFLTLQQKKVPPFKFALNFDGGFFQQNSPTQIFSSRSNKKSQRAGFFTERPRTEGISDNIPLTTMNFAGNGKKTDYFNNKKQYKEKRPRNFTLNELQFKEKFLKNKRQASKDVNSQNSSSNMSKRPNSLSLGHKPKAETIENATPKPNRTMVNSRATIREKNFLNKDKVSAFNKIFEKNEISDIVQVDNRNNFKINKELFQNFRKSINFSKNSKTNEYSFKIFEGGHEKTLLRYNPIIKKPNHLNTNSLSKEKDFSQFATDKELEIFNQGFAEMDLCGDSKKPIFMRKKEKDIKEICQENQTISSRLYKNLLEKPKHENFIDNMHFSSGFRLSLGQIEYLREEFAKERNAMNFQKVDYLLRNLKFFTKFSESIRIHFLKRVKFVEYPAQQIIFKEGDFGDLMYVIMRGSVNIRITKQLDVYEGISSSFVVNSFYDGDHFGDLAMMKTNKTAALLKSKALMNHVYRIKDVRQYLNKCDEIMQGEHKTFNINREAEKEYFGIQENEEKKTMERTKRAATIETVEQCFCLTLSRDEYQYIYTNILQKSLEEKLNALMNCSIFEGIEAYNLLPLANVLEEKSFKLGEPLIKKGEEVTSFFIVSKGKCDLVLEYNDIRQLNPYKDFKNKGLKIKDVGDPELFEKAKLNHIKKLNHDSPEDKEGLSPRNFPNQKILVKNSIKIANDHQIIRSFLKGDCFGERALLTDVELTKKALYFKKETIPLEAQLCVIADMNKTKVYIIKSSGFHAVPIELKNEIRNILIETPEFDHYDIEELKNDQKNWADLAKKIIKKKVLADMKKNNNLFKLSHLE